MKRLLLALLLGVSAFAVDQPVTNPKFFGTGKGILTTPGGAIINFDTKTLTGWSGLGSGNVATDAIWDAAGDLAVGTGADTAVRLAKGSALQQLRVNAAGTALEWATISSGGAPTAATYITQTADGTLSAEQALDSLATGILKNTTTTGVLSIAVAGADYVAPNGSGAGLTSLPVPTLITVADALGAAVTYPLLALTPSTGDKAPKTSGAYTFAADTGTLVAPIFSASGAGFVGSGAGLTGVATASSNFGGDNLLLRSDGVTKGAQGSGITVDDSNNVSGMGTIAGSRLNVPAGKVVYVDSVNGSDSLGARETTKSFLTLTAAKTAASSGDVIYVRPGQYDERNLLKNGVNWYFELGATVNYTGSTTGSLFDDSANGANTAITCIVGGFGRFVHSGSFEFSVEEPDSAPGDDNVVHITNSGSNIGIFAVSISNVRTGNKATQDSAVRHRAGTLKVHCLVVSSVDANGVWWDDGESSLNADVVEVTGVTGVAIYATLQPSSTANWWVNVKDIHDTGNQAVQIVNTSSLASTARVWINAQQITGSGTAASTILVGAGFVYFDLLKLRTREAVTGIEVENFANVWLTVQKISNEKNSFAIDVSGSASLVAQIQTMEAPLNTNAVITQSGGTAKVQIVEAASPSTLTTGWVALSSGTMRFRGNLNTSLASAGNPIFKSGGTLILDSATLVAHSSRDSITAGTAQNVVSLASFANKDVNSNVTITTAGGLLIDSNVK